jgi:hypothetical protein
MKSLLRPVFLIAICLLPHFVHATIMVPLAMDELSQRAELVVRGTVTRKTCLKDPEGRIYTKVEFKVSEVWKGTLATNTFTIVHAGGTVGDERTAVDGEASYEIGEDLVTFLRLNQRGEGVSIGLAQGKFSVWKDDVSGESFVYNLFHGQPKGPETAANNALRIAAGKPKRLTLSELQNRVTGVTR